MLSIKEYCANRKSQIKSMGLNLKLGIIDATAAGDYANSVYIKKKVEDCEELGWSAQVYKGKDVRELIKSASEDACDGIIVQLPVAEGVEFDSNWIPVEADCDGLRVDSKVNPATPQGIINYLKAIDFEFEGKHAVVMGRSDIVGKPMARMLLEQNCTTSVIHSKTPQDLKAILLAQADLIVVAVGKEGVLRREECPHAFVVDVGINRNAAGKLCGDFVEDGGISTPVPGGVGLLTRLALLENIMELSEWV